MLPHSWYYSLLTKLGGVFKNEIRKLISRDDIGACA